MSDANPTYRLDGCDYLVTMRLSTICHDMGMRAYFKWKEFSQERAEAEYYKSYFGELRRLVPDHPHLKDAPAESLR